MDASDKPVDHSEHVAEQAERAAKSFGDRLGRIMDELSLTRGRVAELAECDSTTVDKLVGGLTQPLLRTAYAIIRGIAAVSPKDAAALVCDFEIVRRSAPGAADFNADGIEDEHDLVPGAAHLANHANEVLMITIAAMNNDCMVDNSERLKLMRELVDLRDTANALDDLIRVANDRWSRRQGKRS